MNGADYKEKIRKLLSLASYDNENEAKAALLKAKELMAEHKLTEADLQEMKNKKVVDQRTEIEFTMQSEAWLPRLADVISENYCCNWYRNRKWNARKGVVCLIGLEGDIDICKIVLEYAVDSARTRIRKMKRSLKKDGYSASRIKGMCFSYGEGFSAGVDISYKEQSKKHQEWGLVLVKPVEVDDYMKKKVKKSFSATIDLSISASCYDDGLEDGKNFDVSKRVEAAQPVATAYIA